MLVGVVVVSMSMVRWLCGCYLDVVDSQYWNRRWWGWHGGGLNLYGGERDFFKIIHSFFFYFFFSLFLPKTFPWQIFLSRKFSIFFPFSFTPYWGSKQLTCQNLVLWLMGLLCFWKNQKVKITGTYCGLN